MKPNVEIMFDGRGLAATEVYKNKTDKSMNVTFNLIDGRGTFYKYEDDCKQDWNIGDRQKEILGYKCTCATTSFRGRNYTAWFTTDIPVNDGPWKFSGLPGLILEISDSDNYFSFKCTGIEQPKVFQPIVKYEAKYASIDRKKLNKLIFDMNTNFARYMSKYRIIKEQDKDGNILDKPDKVPDKKYVSVELE